ncbi:MAG: 4'-phosphopantetheinyl transferase superfamily protein [Planctomycetota bacterium]
MHIYQASLEASEERLAALRPHLSQDEVTRARRYLRPEVGRRFTVSRGYLRRLLSAYLGVDPGTVRLVYGEEDKPQLADEFRDSQVEFNLSHSHERVLYAVTRGRAVGIDVERTREQRDLEAIARRFFAREEAEQLCALPPGERCLAFYRCWTRKEAYLKAKGGGLTFPLHRFQVTFTAAEPARLLRSELDPPGTPWVMRELLAGPEYVACVMVAGRELEARCWQLE